MADIDLVAVAYNAAHETARFLASLKDVEVPFTFTIIDNASPDGMTRSAIKAALSDIEDLENCEHVDYLESAENLGYAKACNLGATYGDAKYLALLNCDILFRPGAVSRIIQTFEGDESIGVVGPRTIDSQGRLTHAGIVKKQNGMDGHRFWLQKDVGQAGDVLDVPTVSGATYFVRRSMWEDLTGCDVYQAVSPAQGAFLPTSHYFEETFCSYHARAHGYRVVYDGRALMVHEWNRSSTSVSAAAKHWAPSKDLYLRACKAHQILDHGAGA